MSKRKRSRQRVEEGIRIARAQGLFNVVGGAWPIISLRSFEAIFGRKTDDYVQKASGGLFLSTGIAQLLAEETEDGVLHARRIGVAAAMTYLALDLIYVPRGKMPRTYLFDAAIEIGWLWRWWRWTVA